MNEESDPKLEIRFTTMDDRPLLKSWLSQHGMEQCFPMANEMEIDDAVQKWIFFSRYRASLTSVYDGVTCGLASLYLLPYERLAHQCEWGIILSSDYHGKKIGTALTNALINLAKERFSIELLHLQVLESNSNGREFFQRFGFTEFGRQNQWFKGQDEYRARILMEKRI